jgi:hypothetical protein
MVRKQYCFASTILIVALFGLSGAQERLTERTFKLSAGQQSPPATIADIAWLAGHWTGDGLGGVSEEMWTPPRNGVMLGMYRLIRDGKPAFYELLTIAEENGTLALRLKHFNADLTGWEEKDKSVSFQYVSKTDRTVHFNGLTFQRDNDDQLTIFLALRQKDGSLREEVFRLKRAQR